MNVLNFYKRLTVCTGVADSEPSFAVVVQYNWHFAKQKVRPVRQEAPGVKREGIPSGKA
jgi:hypothetical protein